MLLNRYYEMEDKFYKFLKSRIQKDWEGFWYDFENFFTIVEREYKEKCSIEYYEYKWMGYLWRKNYLVREAMSFFYETLEALTMVFLLIMYIIIFGKITNNPVVTPEISYLVFTFSSPIVLSYCFLRIVNSEYLNLRRAQREKNLLAKIFEKNFPKVYKIRSSNTEKERIMRLKNLIIPQMHEKNTM